jgi:AcrR family transcriptional regulator
MEKTSAKTVLFDKAMELFRRHGYDNVTIQKICKASNVTRNAFYYYFDSKDGLLSSYFENIPDFTETLLADIQTFPNDWEKLWYIFEAHLKLMENEGLSICRALIKVNVDGNGEFLTKYYVSETVTIPLLRSCQSSGLVRNMMEPRALIYLATRMIAGILLTWCCKSGQFDLIASSKEAFSVLLSPVGNEV